MTRGSSEMSYTDKQHFESKADSGASKTYPQQAVAICKGRPYKIVNGSGKEGWTTSIGLGALFISLGIVRFSFST